MTKMQKWAPFHLTQKAIFTPKIDLAVTSGISILVMVTLVSWYFFSGMPDSATAQDILPKLLILQVLLNWPHFLVSYRLLYKKENFKEFPLATLIIPSILLSICAASVMPIFGGDGIFNANIKISYLIWIFSTFYLAWHYTGQAWGMMMVYSRISGIIFSKIESILLRTSLRILIAWHVIWGLQTLPPLPYLAALQSDTSQQVVNIVALISFIMGCVVFTKKSFEQSIDIRIFGAWLVTYLWYLVLFLIPKAFMFVQFSHALQYMIFPMRVELNRDLSKDQRISSRSKVRVFTIYILSILGGLLIFYVPDVLIPNSSQTPTLFALIAISINIHHFYTDSAIWKLRNKKTRGLLFTHLQK
ncbi:MAG: hypothetical protein HWD81_00640 [Marivivens sp.]|nr:hypothetical protein [Marivivens sp.]